MANSKSAQLNLFLKAHDNISGIVHSAVTKSDKDFEDLRAKIKQTGDTLSDIGKKSIMMGGALIGAAGAGAFMAGNFEAGMNNVSTLIDTNQESLSDMGKNILNIASESAKAISDLSDGLYSIRSAGMSAEDQFNILDNSARLAVAGLSTTAEAVDIATSAINAFNLQGKEQNQIYDMFFKVVKYGKTNISEFAQGFGSVAGVVASASIQLDEYSASVAAMTISGLKANIAHTQLKAAIAGLSRGSKEQMVIFNKLGAKSFKDLIQKSGGMVNAFEKIYRSLNGNESALIQLLGSVEAYNAVLSLTGANNKTFRQTLDDMRNGSNALNEAYEKQMSGMNNQIASLKNNFQVLGIEFGNGLLPLIKGTSTAIKGVVNNLSLLPTPVKEFVSITTAMTGVSLVAFGGLSMAAGSAIRGFSDLLNVYRKLDIYFWAHPLNLPKFEVRNTIANLNIMKNAAINVFRDARLNALLFSRALKGLPAQVTKNTMALFALNKVSSMGSIKTVPPILSILDKALFSSTRAIFAFSTSLLTCPITWIAAAVVGAGLLIFKYWKPLTNFFKGLWQGVKEACAPLQPLFNKVAQAVKPIVDWFKALVKPVDDVDNKALNFGITVGKAIGGAINWIIKMGKAIWNVLKWTQPLFWLFKGGKWIAEIRHKNDKNNDKKSKNEPNPKLDADGSHKTGLSNVPYDGYHAILHKNERVLTAEENKNYTNSNGFILQYSPVIQLMGELREAPRWLVDLLKKHSDEVLMRLKQEQERMQARSYVNA